MSDIVERIRRRQSFPGALADEAADEIERLRAALQTLLEKTDYTQADVEAARRALEGK